MGYSPSIDSGVVSHAGRQDLVVTEIASPDISHFDLHSSLRRAVYGVRCRVSHCDLLQESIMSQRVLGPWTIHPDP